MKNKLQSLVIKDLMINPPIIQGGMGVRVSGASLAGAVSNLGALGVIAAVGLGEEYPDKEVDYKKRSELGLRDMIRETKRLTSNPFGVNIMCALTNYDDLVRVAVEEKVDVIMSGAGLPLHLPALAKNSSTKMIPIVSSARAADIILRIWMKRYQRLPDAFIVEGPLAGGHLGFSYTEILGIKQVSLTGIVQEILSLIGKYEKKYNTKIPLIAAGGVFDGKDIAQMLKLGVSGVQMATRFVCTKECDVSDKYKEAYLTCKEDDIVVILSPTGMPARVIKNKVVERIQSGEKMKFVCSYRCLKPCDPYSANYCIAQMLVNAYRGNLDNGFAMCGANAHRIKEITTVKELIDQLVEETVKDL